MGEMADFALDEIDNADAEYCRLISEDSRTWDDMDREFMQDYDGTLYPSPFSAFTRKAKPSGPGKCPQCGSDTIFKSGRNGDFYGCTRFPDCKGSRNAEQVSIESILSHYK